MLLGNQCVSNPLKINSLINAITKFNIPLYMSGMARGLLRSNYPLYYHHKRTEALKEADLVILAGVPLDFRLNYGQLINTSAELIGINLSREELHLNRNLQLKIQEDPQEYLIKLAKLFDQAQNHEYIPTWNQILQTRELERNQEIKKMASMETEFINPLRLCAELIPFLSEKSTLVADGGDFVATASYLIFPRHPLGWLDPGPYGTLGVGAGFALAAKLCYPDDDVWIIFGDGAVGYSLIEFDTFVRHNIPIIALVGNDGGWTQIARDQIDIFKDPVGTLLKRSDYHLTVQGFGAKGLFLEKTEAIQTVFKQAIDLTKKKIPVLINTLIGTTEFRKGSISM